MTVDVAKDVTVADVDIVDYFPKDLQYLGDLTPTVNNGTVITGYNLTDNPTTGQPNTPRQ